MCTSSHFGVQFHTSVCSLCVHVCRLLDLGCRVFVCVQRIFGAGSGGINASYIQPGDVHGMDVSRITSLHGRQSPVGACNMLGDGVSGDILAITLPCDRAKQLRFNEPIMKIIEPLRLGGPRLSLMLADRTNLLSNDTLRFGIQALLCLMLPLSLIHI